MDFIRPIRLKPIHGRSFTPRFGMNFPARKKLNLSMEELSELLEDGNFFIRGDIDLPDDEKVMVMSLSARRCGLHEVATLDKVDIIKFFERGKVSFDKRLQLITHVVMAVREGLIPLPAEGDDGVMAFCYRRKVNYGVGQFTLEAWMITLIPDFGRWRIDDRYDMFSLMPGDACCIMEH